MAALIPTASVTGSGTMTLAGPSTNANQTITIPDATGTMMLNGPAFGYYQSSAQTLSAATFTKITLTSSLFDTNSCFASSRFTPTVSGYYQFNGSVTVNGTSQEIISALYKNGSAYYYSNDPLSAYQTGVSGIIYCNGSTDYVELYGFFSLGGNTNASQVRTNFSGAMVRGV